jgi:chitodextrinase
MLHSYRLIPHLILVCGISISTLQAQSPAVPSEYQDLYSMMQNQIATFDQTVLRSWDRSKPPVAFSAHLLSANSNQGAVLLDPTNLTSVTAELDGIQALGAKAVSLSIDYPILDPAFDPYGGQAANYLSFYKQVISGIHARGLKVIVETGAVFSQAAFSNLNVKPYYDSLTTVQYGLGRANQALLMAQQLAPDYLSVIQEPDTEASQTGKSELGTVSGSTALLNQILSVYRRSGGPTVPIGAGVGTWINPYDQFIQAFVATSIDFVDIHIYPVNKDYLTRAFKIADMADAAGKPIAMSEMWSHKVRDNELGFLSEPTAFSRDNYSFWAPLDTQFLQAMVDFAFYRKLLFAAAFQDTCFRAYIDYDSTTSGMNYYQLGKAAAEFQSAAVTNGDFTSTGRNWENSILGFTDVTAPLPPVVTLGGALPNSLSFTWVNSGDNVGTAGFYVYRDGTKLTQTDIPNYFDQGLKDGATYHYTVTAFDASGNLSAGSPALTVSTPDITPPSVPANLRVTVRSSDEIDLSWSPSTDNVAVVSYRIYRGATATSLGLNANSNVTTYADTALRGGTSFCYAIAAVDATMMASAKSSAVCVTLSDTTPPGVPTKLTATALSRSLVKVTWSAPHDNVAVSGYQVQRAIGNGSSVVIGKATTTTYSDATAVPNTKYTYKVLAYDAAQNQSGLSAGVRVTTPQ